MIGYYFSKFFLPLDKMHKTCHQKKKLLKREINFRYLKVSQGTTGTPIKTPFYHILATLNMLFLTDFLTPMLIFSTILVCSLFR